MMRSSDGFSRRAMLRATGAAALALPFLRASRVHAAPAKKLVLVHTPNGIEQLRSSLPPGLERMRSQLIVVDGIDWGAVDKGAGGDDHFKGPNGSFTANVRGDGRPAGPSIDQYLVNTLKPDTRFPSLQLGVMTGDSGGAHPNASMDGTVIPSESDPKKAFDRLFGGLMPGGSPAPSAQGPSPAERLRLRRKSVLDHVVGELGTVRAQMVAEERYKFERHLESLREIERRLTAMPAANPVTGASCAGDTLREVAERARKEIPPYSQQYDVYYQPAGQVMGDMIVLALACGLTRFPTLRWSYRVSNIRHSWLGSQRGHHDLAHGGAADAAELKKVTDWYGERFAQFVGQLAATPDPAGGTLLEASAVLWGTDMADGNHSFRNGLFLLAGRAGGGLSPGRTIKPTGAQHGELLLSLCHVMGAQNAVFGNPAYCKGPLAGL